MNYSKITFLSLFLIGLSTPVLYAQDQMQPAEMVLNNNDTLKGYIDYEAWELDSQLVLFSETNERKNVKTYEPNMVKALFIGGKYYKGAGVEVEISSRNSISLSKSKELNIERRIVFLQVLVDGDKQLLYFKDQLGKDHFYFFMDDEIKLLIYRQYLKLMTNMHSSAERFTKTENNKFKGQLGYYFNDCSQSIGIESAQYNISSLTNLYRQYYKCRKSGLNGKKADSQSKEAVFYSTGKKASTFGAVAGLNFYSEPSGTGFVLGITNSILLPTDAANLTFHNELMFYGYSTEHETRSVNSSYQVVNSKFKRKTSLLRLGSNLRIALSKGSGMQPFLGAGAAIELPVRTERESDDKPETSFRPNISGGLQGKKMFLEMKFDVGQNQFFTLLGFRFGS